MFGTPLIAFSIGAATVCSSVSADAPGYTAVTLTTGGAISGYCAIGSVRIAARPASTRNSDITAAKIGRSMKKRENMLAARDQDLGAVAALPPSFLPDVPPSFAGAAPDFPPSFAGAPPGDAGPPP